MTKEQTNEIRPTKSVYCYYFPETRDAISRITSAYPHDVFLRSINPGLDDFHKPVIDSYLKHFDQQLPDLGNFPYQYVSAGASEGIFHTLSEIAAFRHDTPLYVLEGEYEGYAGYGTNLGLKFQSVKDIDDFNALPKGIVFISNPSARDGNIIPQEQMDRLCESGHEIVLDITYVGLTKRQTFLVDHPAVSKTIVSLSKPFGLYYYRTGFMFSRAEMKTLEVNKWFKGILPLIIAKELLDKTTDEQFYNKYRSLQRSAISQWQEKCDFPIQPSDVLLLAHSKSVEVPQKSKEKVSEFDRKSNYRFCLTPYFLEKERGFV